MELRKKMEAELVLQLKEECYFSVFFFSLSFLCLCDSMAGDFVKYS